MVHKRHFVSSFGVWCIPLRKGVRGFFEQVNSFTSLEEIYTV